MKSIVTFLYCFIWIQLFACCNSEMENSTNDSLKTDSMVLKISVGTKTFRTTLYNNETVAAFKSRLPMTITMSELNGNEKYVDLQNSLPANASNLGNIQAGDLMLFGSNTLVLFYKAFSTSYNYTPLGRIENAAGLAATLGSGNVSVTFALQ